MKIKLLVSLLLLTLFVELHGQPIGAKWYFSHPITEGNYNKIGYIKYAYLKDSLIAGKAVQTISITKHQSANSIETFGNMYVHQQGDSTLFFNPYTNQFHLLFNFSAQKGDTVTVFNASCRVPDYFMGTGTIHQFRYIILRVDTINIDGKVYRKQFYKNHNQSDWRFGENTIDEIDTNEFILEKIGPSRYFLGYSVNVTVEQNQPLLRCYNDSNTDYKNPNRESDCDYYRLPSGINELSTSQSCEYTLTENELAFNNLDASYHVYIYSGLGTLLVEQDISSLNNKINIDKLTSGLNALVLKHPSKKTITFKVLKQ
jgi:hypothetical protein